MKVVYYSRPCFADCDFPLIKSLQNKGIDVRYYISLQKGFQRDNLIEFEKPINSLRFIKAAKFEEMNKYKDCLDLNRFYIIAGYRNVKYWIPSWILWMYSIIHMLLQRPDVIHITWQLSSPFERLILVFTKLFKKKIMTVHDPIPHSGNFSEKSEDDRIHSFCWANRFILLNDVQSKAFTIKYNIDIKKISISRLGVYDSISRVQPQSSSISQPYILFFGIINKYKGIEFLLEAMSMIHNEYPHLKLVIAGKGRLYFDASEYMNCEYVEWRNRYIGVSELAGLIRDSLCCICPYTDATQSGVIQTSFSIGVPVIATSVGALPQAVKDGINGLIVKPCDTTELYNAIKKIITHDDLRNNLINNLKENWIKESGWDEISDDYIEIYNYSL